MRGFLLMVALLFAATIGTEWYPAPQKIHVATPSENTLETKTLEEVAPAEKDTYRVIKVVDGDTLALEMEGKSVTVRLIGIDTPETLDPRKPVQCFGQEASQKAKELLEGKRVSVEKDAGQGELDKYGRLLLYVFLENGRNFAEEMISGGYAHEYTYNLPYKYLDAFKAAEKEAREVRRGLWSDDACALESARKTTRPPLVPAPSGNYQCSRNAYNCPSFKTQAEAQAAFESCGGASNDVHKLDNDKDGSVCESLP